ncbi:pantetheine-phosphate adenylyltransferase [Prosthecobacter vanneervenii]|uniref:Phosphopantetheine adenylyltransferase n=1 Tax=Prosthecobacter vanneervenii TaxID=48466 RepID=A0A7W8DJ14_9BACT|nr:pantetheine-phosphate adenylyltransferase [Prosthecobacter vanneervenii]MBB5031371.1 pantetheine-phosphate adenylyltransferase [Prosthecobacter vanneervenii]
MRRAIYPGSFDPITNGHLDVLQRAAGIFDKLIIAVARDNAKQSLFTVDERVELIRNAAAEIPGIEVMPFEGLLVNFAREHKACALVRGLRAVSDFEFEFQLALMNRKLEPNLETLFLMPREEYTYISSRLVKEICRLGGHIEQFVPPNVVTALRSKFNLD